MTRAFNGTATTADGKEASILISEKAMAYIENRGIDPEVAVKCGIRSDKRGKDTVLVFPYVEDGKVVNHKYRTHDKRFSQDADAVKTFWNAEAINLAVNDDMPLVITEGEFDALAVLTAGYAYVVSVPDGAPQKEVAEDSAKFDYVDRHYKSLEGVRKIVLAGDGDEPGRILNHELQRRLGAHRCHAVSYPEGCKDLNEVLLRHGAIEVRNCIDQAKEYPVAGLYSLNDFPDMPAPVVYSTGIPCMDKLLKLELGRFMVVTGVPGHGKSEFVDTMVYNLAKREGWHICVATFENLPSPHWRDKMVRKWAKADPLFAQSAKVMAARNWINEHFRFICQNPTKEDDKDLDIDAIIDIAEISVIRHGTKILVIDPWDEVDHKRDKRDSETNYTNDVIRKLKKFARSWGVLVVVVAHPQKMNYGGEIKEPSLYDISGSARWNNKCDYGVVVWRPDISSNQVDIKVKKVKNHDYMGKPGVAELEYDTVSGSYLQWVGDAA